MKEVGGLDALRRFTSLFYEKAFADPVLDKFIRSHDDPHGERFATWIAEKFGLGQPWTEERKVRPRCPFAIGHGYSDTIEVHDRSSAHFAAWHSPKRDPEVCILQALSELVARRFFPSTHAAACPYQT